MSSQEEDNNNKLTSEETKNIATLLIICLVLCVASALLAWFTRTDSKQTVAQFLGFSSYYSDDPSKLALVTTFGYLGSVLVGLVSNIIFGMVDNGGLYFGMEALDPFFELFTNDELEKAGYGNTFSDFLGAFLGTFIGAFIENVTAGYNLPDSPLWTQAVGIVIGCLLGIFIPKYVMGM